MAKEKELSFAKEWLSRLTANIVIVAKAASVFFLPEYKEENPL